VVIGFLLLGCGGEGPLGRLTGSGGPPEAVVQTALTLHVASSHRSVRTRPDELTIEHYDLEDAKEAAEKLAKLAGDEASKELRAAASFAPHLAVSPAAKANGAAARYGIWWRGIARTKSGVAEDAEGLIVITKMETGVWLSGGAIIRDDGTLAGSGPFAPAYRGRWERSSGEYIDCVITLSENGTHAYEGDYTCESRSSDWPSRVLQSPVQSKGNVVHLARLDWPPGWNEVSGYNARDVVFVVENENGLGAPEIHLRGETMTLDWETNYLHPTRGSMLEVTFSPQAQTSTASTRNAPAHDAPTNDPATVIDGFNVLHVSRYRRIDGGPAFEDFTAYAEKYLWDAGDTIDVIGVEQKDASAFSLRYRRNAAPEEVLELRRCEDAAWAPQCGD
jgi:hypothetical protein